MANSFRLVEGNGPTSTGGPAWKLPGEKRSLLPGAEKPESTDPSPPTDLLAARNNGGCGT